MTSQVTVSPRARFDVIEQLRYFREQDCEELAERYCAAVNSVFEQLSSQPLLGTAYDSGVSRFGGNALVSRTRF